MPCSRTPGRDQQQDPKSKTTIDPHGYYSEENSAITVPSGETQEERPAAGRGAKPESHAQQLDELTITRRPGDPKSGMENEDAKQLDDHNTR